MLGIIFRWTQEIFLHFVAVIYMQRLNFKF